MQLLQCTSAFEYVNLHIQKEHDPSDENQFLYSENSDIGIHIEMD